VTRYGTENAGLAQSTRISPNFLRGTGVKDTLDGIPLLMPFAQKLCEFEYVFTCRTCVSC
jgi:hypothetical protein